jgi:hypothetical protein
MGLFGDNGKKNRKTNDNNKQSILSKIEAIKLQVRGDAQVLQLLGNVSAELKAQTSSDKKEVARIDVQILTLLDEVTNNVVKGASFAAVNRLDKISGLVNERRQYCAAVGHLTKDQEKLLKDQEKTNKRINKSVNRQNPQTRIEKLLEELEKVQIQLDENEKDFERLKERNAKTPGNVSILEQGRDNRTTREKLEKKKRTLQGELDYERETLRIAEQSKFQEEVVKDRTISIDEHQVNMESLRETKEKSNAELEMLAKDSQEVYGDLGNSVFDDPFAESESVAISDPFAESQSNTHKSFSQSSLGAPEMRGEIAKTKAALEKSIEKYEDKIDDAEEDLRDLEEELKPLLLKRKDASPSECLVLDGKIDGLASKRSGVEYAIRRYRQGKAVLEEKLRLMEKLSTQQDLEQTEREIDRLTEGKFQDFEGLAMYLKNAVQESNEMLEEIGGAGLVADSEEISMNTFSSLASQTFDAPENKDEEKYDALMRDLGLN